LDSIKIILTNVNRFFVAPENVSQSPMKGRLLLITAAILWSLSGVLIKSLDLPPTVIAFYRSLFAALAFMPFLKGRATPLSRWYLLSVPAYTGTVTLLVVATKMTSAANAIVLQYTAPLYVFALSLVFLGERPGKRGIAALIFGMAGIAVIFVGRSGGGDTVGILLGALSGFCFGALIVLLRKMRESDALFTTFVNSLGSALILLPFVTNNLQITGTQALVLIGMGSVQLSLPYFLYTKGLQTITSQEAAILTLIEPLLNPVWVALVVEEIPSIPTIIGGLLIVGGFVVRYAPTKIPVEET
jgi:drug/metabolite transporter (DMT)-like permease